MTQTPLENIPLTWCDERDGAFFSLVRVFGPAFTSGATVLLMSYDEDSVARPGPVARTPAAQGVLA